MRDFLWLFWYNAPMRITESFYKILRDLSVFTTDVSSHEFRQVTTEAEQQLRRSKKIVEKYSREYIEYTIRNRECRDIVEDLDFLLDRTLPSVDEGQRGKYSRLCAVTIVEELYEGAHRREERRVDFSNASHRVLHLGSQKTYELEGEKVNPDIISSIFKGFIQNQEMFLIQPHLHQYVEDPFSPIPNAEE